MREVALHSASTAARLRGAVRRFVRSFGLLASDQTPCGIPLSTSYAHALAVLLESDGASPLTQQELGAALGIDKSNVARLCEKMERAGHLQQRRSPSDGRARLLSLTARGRRLALRVEAESLGRFESIVAALCRSCESPAAVLDAVEALNRAIDEARRAERAA